MNGLLFESSLLRTSTAFRFGLVSVVPVVAVIAVPVDAVSFVSVAAVFVAPVVEVASGVSS